jgi:cobalamin-dependent methionine synthase I
MGLSQIPLFIFYPACPDLKDPTKLFAVHHPEDNVGVRLTTGFSLEPEQSTSSFTIRGENFRCVSRKISSFLR